MRKLDNGESGPFISVILPCFNESESVGECIDEAKAGIELADFDGEVVVVDNNSTDDSVEIALSHGARVVSEKHPGYGSALRAGIQCARGDILIMADADLTYELPALYKLVKPIVDDEADLVLGKRIVESRNAMPFLHRHLGTPVLTKLVKQATGGIKVTDSQSGFRAFKKDVIQNLELSSTGMEFASEMLIKASRKGLRISEIETTYRARVGESKLNTFSDGMRHLREIFLLAPFPLLVIPATVLFAVGLIVEVFSLLHPNGLRIGSMMWQPVFFSGVAMIVSVQALLAGLFLSMRFRGEGAEQQSIQDKAWFPLVVPIGVFSIACGVLLDGGLFLIWLLDATRLTIQAPLASLAQTFLIDGIAIAGFGIFIPMFERPPVKDLPVPDIISGYERLDGGIAHIGESQAAGDFPAM